MLVRNTLTEALPLRTRAGAVGLVLSLEGARYYVFHSRQTRDQVASSVLQRRLELHHDLLHRGHEDPPPYDSAQGQLRYRELIGFARNMAARTAMDPEGRHAEEAMIEHWDEVLRDFANHRHRLPRCADVFLTYCPCQVTNRDPSPARQLGRIHYPLSCHEKLRRFCTTENRSHMHWTVYYEHLFQTVPGLDIHYGNLRIQRLPPHIVMP